MKPLCLFVAWGIPILWACAATVSPLSSPPEPVTKVLRQYALTSANDFPQRDPLDWRLLGSNDGGTHWTTLDARKGELFSDRHQRRLFKLTNRAVFNMYRLQIDQVRDPASANSVHVAEIEPLGQDEDDLDPVPGFGDRITAQGENGPVESRFQAFDGRPETKWLDFASANPQTRASWIQWQYLRPTDVEVTNINQLLMLRARASQAYPIRIAAVFLSRVTGTNVSGFVDATGYLEACWEDAPRLSPGQLVLIEGTSKWQNRQVAMDNCRFTPQGSAASGIPDHVEIDQPLGPEWERRWTEMEGTVQFCIRLENSLVFELQDEDGAVAARVMHLETGASPPLRGSRVRVRGLCSTCVNTKGARVAGTLWVPNMDAVSVIESGPSAESRPAVPELADEPAQSAAILTTIRQIRKLSPTDLARRPHVEVRGVTTEVFGGYLQDEAAGIELWRDGLNPEQPDLPILGTYIAVTGRADWVESHGPVIRVEKILNLGKGRIPRPERPSWAQLANGRMADKWVEIEGVVRATDGSHLLVVGEGGPVMATIRQASALLVRELVDATVRLRGVDIMATDDRGQFQGIQLAVPSLEYVEVERAAADAFSLPTRPIGSLFKVSGPKGFTHRVKIEGVLTFCEERRFFLQDKTGAAMAIGQEEVTLDSPPGAYNWAFFQAPERNARQENWNFKSGDVVQVAGFPENRAGYSPVLTEVLVRKVGASGLQEPVQAAVRDIALGKLDSTLVSLEAVLLGSDGAGTHHLFQLQAGEWIFQAIMPEPAQKLKAIEPGSRVRVTGICQIEASPFPELGKRINSFKLLIESPAGLLVLQQPPWWTPRRALVIAAALVAGLALASGWIGVLRHQVEVRTAQLQKEIEERKRIEAEMELGQKRLLQASRLAGMAEVATNVLHNVGNVLNGANMLATMIGEQVRRSKISSLVKAVGLMSQHKSDLGGFLTQDERGRHLPKLLEQLAAHLEEERCRLEGKVDALTESVQHIKQVVAMQQKYAKTSTLTETVTLSEVVEDALRLTGGALARHEIQVIRQFEPMPTLNLERHKVLQILFNLLENAKRACVESGRADKRITLAICAGDQGRAQIRVHDNGTGIAAENLCRIFAQGFSTRPDGHGFGLHSSLLVAQEMGGSLTAQSDGHGQGAIFTLELAVAIESKSCPPLS